MSPDSLTAMKPLAERPPQIIAWKLPPDHRRQRFDDPARAAAGGVGSDFGDTLPGIAWLEALGPAALGHPRPPAFVRVASEPAVPATLP